MPSRQHLRTTLIAVALGVWTETDMDATEIGNRLGLRTKTVKHLVSKIQASAKSTELRVMLDYVDAIKKADPQKNSLDFDDDLYTDAVLIKAEHSGTDEEHSAGTNGDDDHTDSHMSEVEKLLDAELADQNGQGSESRLERGTGSYREQKVTQIPRNVPSPYAPTLDPSRSALSQPPLPSPGPSETRAESTEQASHGASLTPDRNRAPSKTLKRKACGEPSTDAEVHEPDQPACDNAGNDTTATESVVDNTAQAPPRNKKARNQKRQLPPNYRRPEATDQFYSKDTTEEAWRKLLVDERRIAKQRLATYTDVGRIVEGRISGNGEGQSRNPKCYLCTRMGFDCDIYTELGDRLYNNSHYIDRCARCTYNGTHCKETST